MVKKHIASPNIFKCKDMYNLYKRIRDVNPGYRLFFNAKENLYEIHDEYNHFCSLCIKIKPKDLHAGVIEKLSITRKENMKKYFLQIEEENKKREEKIVTHSLEKSKDIFSSVLEYSGHKNGDVSQIEIKNIIKNLGD